MPDMVETERFFPVKGETPMCSEMRVCMCTRISEHMGVSPLTGKKRSVSTYVRHTRPPPPPPARQHFWER